MGTYRGKILDVNLTSGTVKETKVDEKVLRQFVGGSGLAAKLFLDRVAPNVDPLSEKSVLFLTTGPLTGTNFPTSSRIVASFKSPLTGIWGEATSGGRWAFELKAAGYDGIAIEGASKKPVYLYVEDGRAEIRDASDLWGKDIYQATDAIEQKFRDKGRAEVLVIGPAGEHLVKFANIMNGKWGSLSRCGGGAVMGSKKLKAVVVHGTGKVEPASPDAYASIRKTVADKVKESVITQALNMAGTDMGMNVHAMTGVLPVKNFTLGEGSALAAKVDGSEITAKYLTKPHACYTCSIGCKRTVKVAEGPYAMEEGAGPQFETCGSFGPLIMNDNLAGVLKLNETCNKYGLDSISAGVTIAFGMQCFENGLITSKDLDGGQLRWGNLDDVFAMLEKITYRKGFGNILAEGTRGAAKKIGKNAADYAMQVKGLELPMADPRGAHGLGFGFAMSNIGASHVQHMNLYVESNWCSFSEVGMTGPYDGKVDEGKAQITVPSEHLGQLTSAATLCHFCMISITVTDLVNAINATSGFTYTLDELMQCGERIWMLKRGLNNLMGITSADDQLPKQVLVPHKEGGAAGSTPDMESMMKQYYPLRGLDAKGRPVKEKLDKLGLSDLAAKLAKLP